MGAVPGSALAGSSSASEGPPAGVAAGTVTEGCSQVCVRPILVCLVSGTGVTGVTGFRESVSPSAAVRSRRREQRLERKSLPRCWASQEQPKLCPVTGIPRFAGVPFPRVAALLCESSLVPHLPRCFFRGRDQSRWALERGTGQKEDSASCGVWFPGSHGVFPERPPLSYLGGAALSLWRRLASNEQRLMCFVGLDTSLVLSATWVIYGGVAQGTCTPGKLLMTSWRVGSTAPLTPGHRWSVPSLCADAR